MRPNQMGLQSTRADSPSIVVTLPHDAPAPCNTARKRLAFVDNLRSSMVLLVVAFHTTITYSHIGSWYYNEPGPVDKTSAVLFFAFEAHCQAFFMGLLFLLAGYFVPNAYDRKGFGPFLRDRFTRLGVPALIYMLVIQPLLQHFLLHYGTSFGAYYRGYILSGNVLSGSGPMWFALALLIFSAIYALVRTVRRPNENSPQRAVPGISMLLVAGVALGVISFLVRLVQPLGTSIVNMQLCFFTQYLAMFLTGVVAFRNNWLELFPARSGYLMFAGAAVLSLTVFLPLVVYGGFLENGLSPFLGGWHWQSAAYALWEQLAGVALSAGFLVLYRENISGGGPTSKLLASNSFGSYFLHPPVVVAVAQAFHWLQLAPLLKAVIMIPLCWLAVLGFVHLLARRVPFLRRIL